MSKTEKKKVYSENLKNHHNVQLPVEVLLHQETDPYDVMVFSYMKLRYQFFTHKGLQFCESNTTIASALSISRRKVIECINKLERLGFIHRELRNVSGVDKSEQTNIYTVTDCISKADEQSQQRITTPKPIQKVMPKKEKEVVNDSYWDCPF